MKLEASDLEGLRPLIAEVVRAVMAELSPQAASPGNKRLAFNEPEAAAQLGVAPHVLRDARLRGEIKHTKVGGRIMYTQQQLLDYLRNGEGRR
jgi:hypothetical protein